MKIWNASGWRRTILIYMAVWLACVLWFWLGRGGGGWIMAYTILTFGLILPVTALVSAFTLEWRQNLGFWRWPAMGFFGVMYAAALWATFALSTLLNMTKIAAPSLYTVLAGLCPGAAGLALGWLVRGGKMSLKVPVIGLCLVLVICYAGLKSLNGSMLRFLPILDVPALVLALWGLWLLCRKYGRKQKNEHE